MVSFFGLKLGGDKRRKGQQPATPEVSAKQLRQAGPDGAPAFAAPHGASTWNVSSSRNRSGSSARPGTSHSFRSVTAPRPMFMNGTATASLVDLQTFDHIPRPNRDSLRQNASAVDMRGSFISGDRFSMKPPAAIGGFGAPRPSSRSGDRPSTSTSQKPWAANDKPRTASFAAAPMKSDALDSLFGGSDDHDTTPEHKDIEVHSLAAIVPPPTLNTRLSRNSFSRNRYDDSPITPLDESPLTTLANANLGASPARSLIGGSVAASSPTTHSPSAPVNPAASFSPSQVSPGPSRPRVQPNTAFKPYSPTVALMTSNEPVRARSPSSITTRSVSPNPPSINTTFSAPNSALEPPSSTLTSEGSPMIPESPFSQFKFDFDFGSSSSSKAEDAPKAESVAASPDMEVSDSILRASSVSPSPSSSPSIATHDSALSPRPSVTNSNSSRSIPSPSHSVRSVRSIERPSFEKAANTKPAAPSGLRMVRNAIPSVVPDVSGLKLNVEQKRPSIIDTSRFDARSPTPDEAFVLNGDEALALQWEGPPVIRDVSAKRDTQTVSSPRRQSFTFNMNVHDDDGEEITVTESNSFFERDNVPERPRTSAGPSTGGFGSFGGLGSSMNRSISTDRAEGRVRSMSGSNETSSSVNSRLGAIRPTPLKFNTLGGKTARAMPKSPLSIAPMQAAVVQDSLSAKAQTVELRSPSPQLNMALRSPTFGVPVVHPEPQQAEIATHIVEDYFVASPTVASPTMDTAAAVPTSPTVASPENGTVNSPSWPTRIAFDSVKDKNGYAVPAPRTATIDAVPSTPVTLSMPVPGRHPGRSATDPINERFMSPRPAVKPPGAATTTTSPSPSPSPSEGGMRPLLSVAPTGMLRNDKVRESVRDRVRNLEVRESSSRSPVRRGVSPNGMSPMTTGGRLRDTSLPRTRAVPPPRPKRDVSTPVSMMSNENGFI